GLGIAQEAALKFKETCGLHAEAFSAAEIKHGPMAIVKKGFPVMVFSLQDQTQPSIDAAATAFIDRSARLLAVGKSYDGACNLDTVFGSMAAELRPIIFIQSFYKFVNALSLARGYNPDQPPYLTKVTETL
ncbi:MAG: SIS domain-containing protein, partial [Alphaproteobacteria bacterium]|nr:SIS domain-containing protein [Alphaproteobacteria bacterium]